jgi:hypothetical protein
MKSRVQSMIRAWYRPEVHMETEDWLFIGYTMLACVWGFALGLFIGWILLKIS